MTKKNQNFEMYAGDTKDIVITVTNANGAVVNLSGASVRWALKKNVSASQNAYKTTSSGVTLTSPSAGVFTVRLSAGDTQGLQGRYYHEAEVTDVLGNVSTVTTGYVTIEPSGV